MDRPIIFSGPMVRALLAGRKTQTRRVIKPQPDIRYNDDGEFGQVVGWLWKDCSGPPCIVSGQPVCVSRRLSEMPLRYAVGDRLYVRETHFQWGMWDYQPDRERKWQFLPDKNASPWFMYEGDQAKGYEPPKRVPGRLAWYRRPAIFTPREVSRLTLIVEAVKVERLQDISEDDAHAEGALRMVLDDDAKFYENARGTFKCGFAGIWAHINGKESWDANPWIVAVTFRVERANIDAQRGRR